MNTQFKNSLQVYLSSSHHSGARAGPTPSIKPQAPVYQGSFHTPSPALRLPPSNARTMPTFFTHFTPLSSLATCNLLSNLRHMLNRDQQIFFCKGPRVNILGFLGHKAKSRISCRYLGDKRENILSRLIYI